MIQFPGVLHIGNFLSRHGKTTQQIEDLADRLAACGWSILRTSSRLNRAARLADMLTTIVRRRKQYEVAHIALFSGAAFLWADCSARLLRAIGRPFVVSLHGGNLPRYTARRPARVRRLLHSAVSVVAPSRYLAEALAPYAPPIQLIPNAFDLAHYPFVSRETLAPRLVWLRSFHQIYRPQLAPAVLARLLPQFPETTLLMVGPEKDSSLAQTRAEAERLGVGARVEIIPGVPKAQVPAMLARGDIFLNTTSIDNTPVSVLEAMACGLCVVSTDVGGIPYLLTEGDDALLTPPDDAAAMADAALRLLGDRALAARISAGGRATAERCDWAQTLPLWEQMLRDAAGGMR